MNQKRKAELQRKLGMTSVLKPPSGLVERIKADIPHDLMSIERDRERLSRSTAFSVRVAASIILLISATYLSIHLMSRSSESVVPTVARAKLSKQETPAVAQAAPAAPPQAEVTITLADKKEEEKRKDRGESSFDRLGRRSRQFKPQSTIADEQVPAVSGGVVATLPPPPPAAPAPAPAPTREPAAQTAEAPVVAATAERMAVNAAAPALAKSAKAADLDFAQPRAIFGISIDPAAFDRVKHTIEQGARPAAGSVDVAALVNYFAGTSRPPRHEVRLDVEASRAPLADSDKALIRFTVDTPREDVSPGASVPPVATGADLEILLNREAVASHRLIGAEELKTQATLMKNMSVTGMLDMKLKPRVPRRTTVATLTLRYRSVEDGKPHTITRTVQASDLARTWASSTRRHRLATLGAVWSESLNEGGVAGDVATSAERLATEAPDDERARELAALAFAFSRLGS
ncbi:MAG TPA: von Willebrand factor type A domain-containing protein [Thermoanaerobaculia bacterium]|jgi:hypothetical protein|nr:von Willebrand factor type A domain-containing protein [Thermoanaerobaculia bacterium]